MAPGFDRIFAWNPFIHELTLLNHSQKSLDLRGTSIGKLMLDRTGLEELWLGEKRSSSCFRTRARTLVPSMPPEVAVG